MIHSAIGTEQILMIVLVVALIGVLVVMPLFTNKKRQQAVNTLYSSLKVGDKIMTIGGIIGTIKAINQTSPETKEIVIETGVEPNKTTMLLDIKSLLQIIPTNVVSQNFNAQSAVSSSDAQDVFESEGVSEETETSENTTETETVSTVSETVENDVEQPAGEPKAPVKNTYKKTTSNKK